MCEDSNEWQMTMLMAIQRIYILGELAAEVTELFPRIYKPEIHCSSVVGVRIHNGKHIRKAELEVRVKARRVNRHNWSVASFTISLNQGNIFCLDGECVNDDSECG